MLQKAIFTLLASSFLTFSINACECENIILGRLNYIALLRVYDEPWEHPEMFYWMEGYRDGLIDVLGDIKDSKSHTSQCTEN